MAPCRQTSAALDRTHAIAATVSAHERLVARGWRIVIEPRGTRVAGQCDYARRVIVIATDYVAIATDDQLREVLGHEIAHALAGPGARHGRLWQAYARAVGVPARRCTDEAAE